MDRFLAHFASGRNPWVRLPVYLWMGWLALRLSLDASYLTLFGAINLGIHEIGHVALAWAGDVLYTFGGTLFQLLAPFATIVMFVRQGDGFASSFAGVWLATSLYGVAEYLGDARSLALPLVSLGGGDPIHDWNHLLTRFGLLAMDGFLSGGLRLLAFLILWGSMAFGAMLLYAMWTDSQARSTSSRSAL